MIPTRPIGANNLPAVVIGLGDLPSLKKQEWVDLEIIILSEVSQTEKDRYPMTSLGESKISDTNELIYKTDSQRTNLW